VTPYERTQDEAEWTEKKGEIQGEIARLELDQHYDTEIVYAALLDYLYHNLGQKLREEFISFNRDPEQSA
jgi:hypothetical protein